MKKIKEISFRELNRKIVFISGTQTAMSIKNIFNYTENDNGVLAYGYIDHEAGFTFDALCCAAFYDNCLIPGKGNRSATYKIRKFNVNENECFIVENKGPGLAPFMEKMSRIVQKYQVGSAIEQLREFKELDGCRNPDFPDDILAFSLKEGFQPEGLWMRYEQIVDQKIQGILMSEPVQELGLHQQDSIRVQPARIGGEFRCLLLLD